MLVARQRKDKCSEESREIVSIVKRRREWQQGVCALSPVYANKTGYRRGRMFGGLLPCTLAPLRRAREWPGTETP